jgi:SAM-dependent methyltransferase
MEHPRWSERFPILGESTKSTGFDRHYVYHTGWAARVLASTRPERHIDISSSLYFVGLVSAFLPIEHYDYRPPHLNLDGLETRFGDLTRLPFADGSLTSLSCMHVVEHVGLGRYGDPIDPEGDRKAMRELCRILAPGGSLLFVVPVGRPRVCFNAHRIYSLPQVREAFGNLELKEFALVPDDPALGGLLKDPSEAVVNSQNYGCGCFWFAKPAKAS